VALILVSGLLAVLLTGVTRGACYDSSDPALSYCESGPVIGVAGVWIVWTLWLGLAVLGAVRMLRRRP
jgi:hypothetical protein